MFRSPYRADPRSATCIVWQSPGAEEDQRSSCCSSQVKSLAWHWKGDKNNFFGWYGINKQLLHWTRSKVVFNCILVYAIKTIFPLYLCFEKHGWSCVLTKAWWYISWSVLLIFKWWYLEYWSWLMYIRVCHLYYGMLELKFTK